LSFGLPFVVVATDAAQHYGGKRIQELGLGTSLTLRQPRRAGIDERMNAVQQVLATPACLDSVLAFSKHLKSGNSAARAAGTIEQTFR
jgi:UDP:flavonoid glycosyltransferase YjiC (YdhE family)